MENPFRTDLAAEARDLWRRGNAADLPGLFTRREDRDGFMTDLVEIRDEETADKLCKPIGRYVTVELDGLFRREADAFERACAVLAGELRAQLGLSGGESVLVVCLGNRDITPDAVGPLTAEKILVTRHLKESMPDAFAAFRPVSVFCPGVLGTTGVESARLTAAVAETVRPDRIVAVDALAARETSRLCRAVQISNAGVVPGSGVGNARWALTAGTLGVPVTALGAPTVVDARTLCADLGGTVPGGLAEGALFVTPREIDREVRDLARLLGFAVDLALHDALTTADVEAYLS
ncbi:MAG: GPR endopeptidase [Oscillospiraceae bacterium]|nr:GPR endopeptidase [Oscillospiraceae bacterium]